LSGIRYGLAASLLSHGVAYPAEEPVPPSRWGARDQIGNANLLSPELAKKAAALITQGRVYSLGITVDENTNLNPARSFSLELAQIKDLKEGGTAIDDTLHMSLGIGSQIDGFGHFGINGVHYNQNKVDDIFTPTGVKKLGVEGIPPLVTRGVLLDIEKILDQALLEQDAGFGSKEIRLAEKRERVSIQAGDVVLFNTGWLKRWQGGKLGPAPGLTAEGAEYLARKGVIAVGADNGSVDTWSADTFPVHRVLLVRNGIYLLEYIKTEELARDEVYQFMFVLGQPKIKGTVQMSINPIAIR